jgi:sulfhydrogenase subunit beta (sulfur reductase)
MRTSKTPNKLSATGDRLSSVVSHPRLIVRPPRYMISQEKLEAWLDGLAQEQTLIAPRKVSGLVLYRPVENSSEIEFDARQPVLSAKEFFFPPTERLLNIEKTGSEIHLVETLPDEKIILFGVRPCDGRGICLLDSLFIKTKPADPYYALRRENTLVIGLACKELGPNCFCTSVGGAPDSPGGADVMLYPAEDGYVAEAISDKGHFLIVKAGWQESVVGGSGQAGDRRFPVPEKSKWPQHFNDAYWAKISERCLSCRACAYVCPTCRCFAVRDEMLQPGQFERIRCWDACTGENYRRVAGGHRPRAEKSERLRNRFYCKFYYYPEQIQSGAISACTGCGRCISVCPAGVDITEVLTDLERIS